MFEEDIFKSIENFSKLLDRLCPRHARNKQHVCLEDDAPKYVKAFWETVGWSDVVGGGGNVRQLLRPERQHSIIFMEDFFDTWFEKAPIRDKWRVAVNDYQEAWKQLPAKFRVIVASRNNPSLLDESNDMANPGIVTITPTVAEIESELDLFLTHIIRATLKRVMYCRTAGVRNIKPSGHKNIGAAFPNLWELSTGVWGMTETEILVGNESSDHIQRIFYEHLNNYIDFILTQPDELLSFFTPPAGQFFLLAPSQTLDPSTIELPGFRRFFQITQGRQFFHAIGHIEGRAVWIVRRLECSTITLIVANEDFHDTLVWLKANRIKLDERPEKYEDMWISNHAKE